MPGKPRQFNWFQSALAVCLPAVLAVAGCKRQASNETVPNIDALKNVLQKSAEATLPAPNVANERIELHKPAPESAGELERVMKIVTETNGTGIRTTDVTGNPMVLAHIPGERVEQFRSRVTGRQERTGAAPPAGMQLIEVVILVPGQ
jgi:hypothetical protein